MASPADFNPLAHRLAGRARRRCLPDRVGKRLQVIGRGFLAGSQREPDDVPAAGGSEPVGVRAAEVVTMRFDVGGERTEDRGRIPVHIRQRAYGDAFAGRA